jgi:uncharacterized protein DUF6496
MAKYGKQAQQKVKRAMHERKHGALRSGGSGKRVTSRKQAIAIGLSEARRAGGKVPRRSAETRDARHQATLRLGPCLVRGGRVGTESPSRQFSRSLLPDPAQMHDHLDGLFHVPHGHPFEARVEVVLAGEQVRCRKADE